MICDYMDPFFERGRIFTAASLSANFFAQFFALGVKPLQRRLRLPPFGIQAQQLINLRIVAAGTQGEPFLHQVGLFANKSNIEHGLGL